MTFHKKGCLQVCWGCSHPWMCVCVCVWGGGVVLYLRYRPIILHPPPSYPDPPAHPPVPLTPRAPHPPSTGTSSAHISHAPFCVLHTVCAVVIDIQMCLTWMKYTLWRVRMFISNHCLFIFSMGPEFARFWVNRTLRKWNDSFSQSIVYFLSSSVDFLLCHSFCHDLPHIHWLWLS